MAPASASFQAATKALERMKDESQRNTAHGNAAALGCEEERDGFQTQEQRSASIGTRHRGRDGAKKRERMCQLD